VTTPRGCFGKVCSVRLVRNTSRRRTAGTRQLRTVRQSRAARAPPKSENPTTSHLDALQAPGACQAVEITSFDDVRVAHDQALSRPLQHGSDGARGLERAAALPIRAPQNFWILDSARASSAVALSGSLHPSADGSRPLRAHEKKSRGRSRLVKYTTPKTSGAAAARRPLFALTPKSRSAGAAVTALDVCAAMDIGHRLLRIRLAVMVGTVAGIQTQLAAAVAIARAGSWRSWLPGRRSRSRCWA
jgi:hypothetical protein